MTALIFDCDGVLADTERYGHLPAFNQTFREFGLPVQWSDAEYAEKVKIGGGKERISSLLTTQFVEQAKLPRDVAAQQELVRSWHHRKSAIYADLVKSGVMPGRPGITRLATEAKEAGWQLAVASTSAEPSVRAVLEHTLGPLASSFVIFAGDVVRQKKPSPDIYLYALDKLGADRDQAIVIEDSANGLQAALGAGMRTVITTSTYTVQECFDGASLVVDSLGSAAQPARVIADPLHLEPTPQVLLTHLSAILTDLSVEEQ